MNDREHQVRECAYYLWEAEGRPEGRAQMHWTMAEIATTLFSYLNAANKPPTSDRAVESVAQVSFTCQSKAASGLGDQVQKPLRFDEKSSSSPDQQA